MVIILRSLSVNPTGIGRPSHSDGIPVCTEFVFAYQDAEMIAKDVVGLVRRIMTYVKLAVTFVLLQTMLISCAQSDQAAEQKEPAVVGDLAYHGGQSQPHRIYLAEGEQSVPYLVLTNDDLDGTLLLREFVLDDNQPYAVKEDECSAYYANSYADEYLNSVFYDAFSDDIKRCILTTDVEIATKTSVKLYRKETEFISRKVFLLSLRELRGGLTSVAAQEGTPIAYFNTTERRKAYRSDGTTAPWFLRTAKMAGQSIVFGITAEGAFAQTGTHTILGVTMGALRPAMRILSSTPVIETTEGEFGYRIP